MARFELGVDRVDPRMMPISTVMSGSVPQRPIARWTEPDIATGFLRTRPNPFVPTGLVLLTVAELGEPILDHMDRDRLVVLKRLSQHEPPAIVGHVVAGVHPRVGKKAGVLKPRLWTQSERTACLMCWSDASVPECVLVSV